MKILAFEFSSSQRSVAAVENAADISLVKGFACETGGRNTHATSLVEESFRQSGFTREQIDLLAIGLGPGSYAGIRASIAFAQGWQLARGTQLVGISSVEALAAQAFQEGIFGRVHFVIDAQRKEFYLATYAISAGGRHEIEPLHLVSLAEVEKLVAAKEMVAGPEISQSFQGGRDLFPNAAVLGELAAGKKSFIPGEKLEPIYLRETTFIKAPPRRII
ncbi:MAG: tRNA (adenosine(37)-N6)-threonylcarbamoyltransferase complex dimerization subunit type 1 TsaB [Verrucomicrobiota bacterium]